MSCCAAGTSHGAMPGAIPSREEVLHLSQPLDGGRIRTVLSVPDMHCGGCIRAVEGALSTLPGVDNARVNLSTKRAILEWDAKNADAAAAFEALSRAGYGAHLSGIEAPGTDRRLRELILSLGVAGFAAGNIMLLSVSVWAGAEGTTRDLFHWISALIAIPAVGFSGRIFFRPALKALRVGRLNMDVPISLAVLLAVGMSLYETATHGAHAYFDASVTLLFFLLIGRALDHVMRERARGAVASLGRLTPEGATVVTPDGQRAWTPLNDIAAGDQIALAAGERIPVDCRVAEGTSDIDMSIATGESVPVAAQPGVTLPAGAMNLTGPLLVTAEKTAQSSFIAEMTRMLEAAESAHPVYRRLADRAASLYAPVVHLAALASFIGWLWAAGDWHQALMIAVAVLIVTCPCALGLAVPIVQVVAAGRLFKAGIMMRDGTGLEKLARIDRVLFDKTGTLTAGMPRLIAPEQFEPEALSLATALAVESRHPYSRALVTACREAGLTPRGDVKGIEEVPGSGMRALLNGDEIRLGRADWAAPGRQANGGNAGTVLARNSHALAYFDFVDPPREGAKDAIAALAREGIMAEIASGDAKAPVEALAKELGVERAWSRLTPADKMDLLKTQSDQGHRILMVGDGINDAPALAAADVSMVPAKAADIGRHTASFVFLHEDLRALPFALDIARRARSLVMQNFALAALYNVIAVPLAVMGFASPLAAALAMSGSSIIVIANALRLNFGGKAPAKPGPATAPAQAKTKEAFA